MTDETTPKTAIEFLVESKFPPMSYEERMKAYARQVAQQVRQQCAEQAKVKLGEKKITEHGVFTMTVVDKESILSVNIEQFIK